MLSMTTCSRLICRARDPAPRPYHHGNLRAALLEPAERALRERGVGGLSLRELAREVGVSHAAPRRHFADKQALLDALAEDGFERLGARAARARSRAPAPDFDARLPRSRAPTSASRPSTPRCSS